MTPRRVHGRMKDKMLQKRSGWWLFGLLLSFSLILPGCGAPTREQAGLASPEPLASGPSPAAPQAQTVVESVLRTPAPQAQTVVQSVLPTPAPQAQTVARSVLPTPILPPPATSTALATVAVPALSPAPGMPLVLLHSNDIWGETEPCG